MKKINYFITIIIILFLFCIEKTDALVKPTREFYVNDYASILNDDTEKFILEHSQSFYQKTQAQIVVVTVKNLEGRSIEEYATDLFRAFGIGDSKENNGLLLLLALEEKEFRVEVGYGLEGVLTDGLTGRYQDEYIIPYLKEGNWDEGIKNGYSAFYKKLCDYYEIDSEDVQVNEIQQNNNDERDFIFYLILFIIVFIIISFFIIHNGGGPFIGYSYYGGFRSSGGHSFGGNLGGGGSSGGGGSTRHF